MIRQLHSSRRVFVAGAGATCLIGASPVRAAGKSPSNVLRVASPNGALSILLQLPEGRAAFPNWSVRDGEQILVEPSQLALILANGKRLGADARFVDQKLSSVDGDWTPQYGIEARCEGAMNILDANFEDRRLGIAYTIRLAAHDHGVAFRFLLRSARRSQIRLGGEDCRFNFPAGSEAWTSRDEGEYSRTRPGDFAPVPEPLATESTDKGNLADTPLLVRTPSDHYLSISESDRLDYPRMMFRPVSDWSVATHLMHFPARATGYSGPGTTHAAPEFEMRTPAATPWRTVIIGRKPTELIERASFIPTLATPNRLGDTSWIRPGRAFRIRKPYTNERATEGLAFAVRRKLDFIEFDAHWYGDGTDPSDATVPIDGLDVPAIVAAANAKGVGTILYVDRVPAMGQLDAIVRTYRGWGVAGIKFGFVWEGRQEDVAFIERMVRTCGEYKLMVNLHDNLRPAGMERTYPNYIALEGVRGNEQFPTAAHNVTLPFTRNVSGPIDYTICYDHYLNKTTNGHQLAMAAVYYSPLAFLYWYDEARKYASGSWPDLEFLDKCPTTWDETRALAGAVGEYVAVARRRGDRWFLGAMTNGESRTLSIPLAFLGSGGWIAKRFADGKPAAEAFRTPVIVSSSDVDAGDTLELVLAPSGGQALIFERA